MAIGNPGKEEFRDLIVEHRNPHIAFAMARLMDLREEITTNDDLRLRPGVDESTRIHLIQLLQSADRDRRLITYNPGNMDIGTAIANAIDLDPDVAAGIKSPDQLVMGENPFAGDEIQLGSSSLYQLPWDYEGTDANIPLASMLTLSNSGMLLLSAVNKAVVAWTRLESGKRGAFIYVTDSRRMYYYYGQILALLNAIGGNANIADFAQVRAGDEPRGAINAPNRKTETPGTSAGQSQA